MNEIVMIVVSLLLLIIGLLGTILPILPGLFLSFLGVLIYKYLGNTDFPMIYVIIFGILILLSLVMNYMIPMKTTKKYGGSSYGKYGGFIGTIIGLFFPPFGFLIGMLLGVFLGEILHDKTDKKKALQATKGAFIGFLFGTGFNLVIGLAMFLVVLIDMFTHFKI